MREAIERIEAGLPGLMAGTKVPGASVALIGEGQVVWARGFGSKRATEANDPVTASTIFEAAALSKPLFAQLALQLCQEGKLGLDVPLWHYFEYPDLAKEPLAREVTARHVLSHSSGLPNWRKRGEALRFGDPPGERFSYSGEGYVYLQLALERVMEVPLGELARRTVLSGLGMKDSSFVWLDRFAGRVAAGHQPDGAPLPVRRTARANAAWSLLTTASDYARFVAATLDPAQARLMRSWSREMFSSQAPVEGELSWGLGWGLSGSPPESAWHWGANPGYRTFAAARLDGSLGAVVFTNHADGLRVCREVVRWTFGEDHAAFRWSYLTNSGLP
jgi:CubicO group peptidase (beta-lactamase class C family)